MAYDRRRRKKTGRKSLSRKTIFRKRSSLSQAKQIANLDKRVDAITRETYHRIFYKYGEFTDDTGDVYMNQWIVPSSWTKIFNSQVSNELQQSCYVGKIRGQTLIQISGQDHSTPFQCSLFLVTLKKKTATQFLQDTNNGADLVEGEHYTNTDLTNGNFQGNGLVFMNKDIFNVHMCKRFQISESPFYQSTYPTDSTYVTNIKDANKRISWSLDFNKRLKTDNSGVSDVGWKTMTSDDIPPSDRVFTYLFSNPPTATASTLSMASNLLFEIKTVK